jgi:hypothetical protein
VVRQELSRMAGAVERDRSSSVVWSAYDSRPKDTIVPRHNQRQRQWDRSRIRIALAPTNVAAECAASRRENVDRTVDNSLQQDHHRHSEGFVAILEEKLSTTQPRDSEFAGR